MAPLEVQQVPWLPDYSAVANNHTMDYYRQVAHSVDAAGWTTILLQTGEQEVFLGARTSGTAFIVDGLISGTNTEFDAGDNTLTDPSSNDYDIYYGGRGNDTLTGGSANELLLGGDGNDNLNGGKGDDTLNGGPGYDMLAGGDGIDTLIGGSGNDTYIIDRSGELTAITENASEGTDTLQIAFVDAQTISLTGALGAIENVTIAETVVVSGLFGFSRTKDTGLFNLTGNGADNVLTGNGRTNVLDGGAGNDTLYGLGGGDSLNGDIGIDTLQGGAGGDFLTGGAGDDRFVFTSKLAGDADRITDFTEGDLLVLESSVFTGLGAGGVLTPGAFVQGTVAMTSAQHLLYDVAQGYLYYDADGSGIGAKVLVAALNDHPVLDAGDFWVA
jgi:serralysin